MGKHARLTMDDTRLAGLSTRTHTASKDGNKNAAAEMETLVVLESAKLWNLSPSELAEIQRSLKELTE